MFLSINSVFHTRFNDSFNFQEHLWYGETPSERADPMRVCLVLQASFIQENPKPTTDEFANNAEPDQMAQ